MRWKQELQALSQEDLTARKAQLERAMSTLRAALDEGLEAARALSDNNLSTDDVERRGIGHPRQRLEYLQGDVWRVNDEISERDAGMGPESEVWCRRYMINNV